MFFCFTDVNFSQEISDGVRNSARAVQAAEVGIRRIGAVAASQTFGMFCFSEQSMFQCREDHRAEIFGSVFQIQSRVKAMVHICSSLDVP